jgi:hypothetical protein
MKTGKTRNGKRRKRSSTRRNGDIPKLKRMNPSL